MLIRYIIWVFIFYWVFRFIFNFLVPVFRATSQMKNQMRDFNNRMSGESNFQRAQTNAQETSPQPEKPKKGDYIDFEEIK